MPALSASGPIIEVTPGRVRPENEEVSSSLRTGASHDPRVRQPSPPTPDRRHDDPPFRLADPAGLHPRHRRFSAFLGASPDQAGFEDVRRYQFFLSETGAGPPTINHAVTALRFFFQVTLHRPEVMQQIPFVPEPRKLPVVLSPEEVARLLEAAPSLKSKAALSVAYGAGLRVSEVVTLKVGDIDSTRMVIRVEQGKGRKDRYVMLSPQLLALLRAW